MCMKKGIKDIVREKNISEEELEAMVSHTMDLVSDLVPYSDKDYIARVRKLAEDILVDEFFPDPELVKLCEEHDKMLNSDILDF